MAADSDAGDRKLNTKLNEAVVKKEDVAIMTKDTSNYYDQFKAMLIAEGWTTQDHASLYLMPELPNVHNFYAVRKSDNLVLGCLNIVVTDHVVFGNAYVMRKGFRAAGIGIRLVKTFLFTLMEDLSKKPLVGRAVPAMWRPYVNRPFNVKFFYSMYSVKFADRKELKEFFGSAETQRYHAIPLKECKPQQLDAIIEYDRFVTGQNRKTFLTGYFSIDIVEGVALFDSNWKVVGLTAISPTGNTEGLYKLNPIFAENKQAAALLVHTVADRARHPAATFVTHVRRQSAGDWILDKCKQEEKRVNLVGATICATNLPVLYKDRSKPEYMFAPTNSPAHFDG